MPASPMPPVPPGAIPPPPHPPGPAPALPVTSEHKTGNDACIKRLKQLELQPAPKVYPVPAPPATLGSDIDLQTNVFGIEVQKKVELHQYMVSIKADLSTSKEVIFTKKGKEDFIVKDRHEKCCAILFHAFEQNDEFFHAKEKLFIYDGQNMLFSNFNLFQDVAVGAPKTKLIAINGATMGHKDLERLECIKVEVYATKNPSVKFSQEEIGRRSVDANLDSVNRAYHQILELALNQNCIRDYARCVVFEHGKLFFLKPLEEGFEQGDCVDVGDGKQMMPGIKKTVQFIEGPYGRGQNNPSVVIDGMKVAFHKEQPVTEKIHAIQVKDLTNGLSDFEKEKCAAVIKSLDCYTEYTGHRRHLKIEGIHHLGADVARFELKTGGTCTVADYFKDRWKITLKYPKANLIVCNQRGIANFYPMELVCITPNQRVKISQQTSMQSQKTTKESAVLPNIRQRLIMTGKLAAKITTENEFLNDLGVSVCDAPLVVKARKFPPVKLAVSTGGAPLSMKDHKWRMGHHYSRPATPPAIWAMYAVGTQSSRFSPEELKRFQMAFVEMCNSKGIALSPPSDTSLVASHLIEDKLQVASKSGCKFVFIITDDAITTLHQKYKMIENKRHMVIQDMKMTKAVSVIAQGKKLTLENVINKTNVKLAGINYIFTDSKGSLDGVLVIGVGLSNPPPGTKYVMEGKGLLNPMIIGFAYNGKEKQEFTGDFVLSPAGQDTLSPIEDIMKQSIMGYQKWHKGETPKRIMVYRSGVSEGNHGSIMSYEIPLARAAIREFNPKTELVYMAVSKDHTYRFFKTDMNAASSQSSGSMSSGSHSSSSGSRTSTSSGPPKACDMNIGPGIAIDNAVTNPACKQFFLNSHITLQGSAKTPLYTVLSDDTNTPMNDLEDLTYNLCHLHQIVGLSTSIPTPLYVANEYAKRGRNLWNEANAKEPATRGTGSERQRLNDLTETISYKTGEFSDRRVNA